VETAGRIAIFVLSTTWAGKRGYMWTYYTALALVARVFLFNRRHND